MQPEIIDILQALLTPVIGIIAAYVAWQQYRLARQKHDIEIFNRRMQVYKTTVKFLVRCYKKHEINEDAFYSWISDVSDAEFLFGSEIKALLGDIETTAADIIINAKDSVTLPISDEYELAHYDISDADLFNEFLGFQGRASELFAPYFQTFLKLKKIQSDAKYDELKEIEKKESEKLQKEAGRSTEDDLVF